MAKNENILNKEQEQMRLQVVDLELKARYWKAQYDIRQYTLAAEEIQDKYNEYLVKMQERNAELQKQFEQQLEELKKSEEVKVIEK